MSTRRLRRGAQRTVSGRKVIIEKGHVRWTGTMAALVANEAVRLQYLSV